MAHYYVLAIAFQVPYIDQFGQEYSRRNIADLSATAGDVITSIQAVVGSDRLPMAKRPPIVVKLVKASSPKLPLACGQDWEQLKAAWLAEFSKRKIALKVNVIMSKKVRNHSLSSYPVLIYYYTLQLLKEIDEGVGAHLNK